jgi:Ca2+-binding EF-hand superfamily protein
MHSISGRLQGTPHLRKFARNFTAIKTTGKGDFWSGIRHPFRGQINTMNFPRNIGNFGGLYCWRDFQPRQVMGESMKRLALSAACASAVAFGVTARGEEPAQEPAKLFESLDANNDKSLTSDEVSEERKSFFDRIVRIGDKDKDGKLTSEEFVAALSQKEEPVAQPGGEGRPERRRGEGLGQMFERMDRNSDGKITKDEIPDQAPEEIKSRFNALFERIGKDELSREDLAKLFQGGRPPGAGNAGGGRAELSVEVFKRWDRNGDEKLSREEIPEFARERVGKLFDKLGGDTVSFEQLTKAAERKEEKREEKGKEGQPGERPAENVARGDERRPEGDRRPDDRRPEDGEMRRPEGGPGGPGGRGFPGGQGFGGGRGFTLAIVRILDSDENGQLNRDELAKIVDKFGELDRNEDGQIDTRELMGVPGGPGFGGQMGPGGGFGRPQGDRGNDRRPARPEFDREPGNRGPEGQGPDGRGPDGRGPEGDRPRPDGQGPEGRGPGGDRGPEGRGPGDRGPEARGPEGDRPRPEDGQFANADRPRDGERRGPEGDRPRDGERRGPQFGPGGRGPLGLGRLDRDGDGAISKDEATEQMREKFEKLDADSDGKVTFEEFHLAIAREYGFDQRPE